MSRELLKECLDALEYELPIIEDFGSQEQLTMHHNAIAKIYAEFQRTKHANPAAKHWHDLYRAKCQEFHDKQTMLGTEIVALEEELAELKEEIEPLRLLAKMKPRPFMWVGLTDKERNEMIGKIQHDQLTRQRDLIESTQIITEMYLKEKNNA